MRARAKLAIVAIIGTLGLLLGLRLQKWLADTNEERVALDFRLAAAQRAAVVSAALAAPAERLDVLRRFFEARRDGDDEAFGSFIGPWNRDSRGVTYLAFRLGPGPDLVPLRGDLPPEAERTARELAAIGTDGGPRAAVLGGSGAASASLLIASVAEGRGGERLALFALVDVRKCLDAAIGEGDAWGLPVSILDPASPDPLYFHPPRLDASLGSPLAGPEPAPRYSYAESVSVAGLPLDVRVDASPKYREERRRWLYVVIAPMVSLFTLLSALGLSEARRRLALAEAGRTTATAKLERFFSVNLDLLCIMDRGGTIATLNPAWEAVLGYPVGELEGRSILELIHEEEVPEARQILRDLSSGIAGGFIDRMRTKDGEYRRLEWRAAADGGSIYAAARDITERERNEERLEKALEEKETLLREVHHRVKNNLQIIASVLSLQGDEAADSRFSAIIDRAQSRIRSMALVHEAIYRSGDFSGVDFREYAQALVSEYEPYAAGRAMQVSLDSDCVLLDLDLAVHCGLLLNELATNAAKHACDSSGSPALSISLRESDGALLLAVEDNGPGLPSDFEIPRCSRLGLKIAASLAAQLSGSPGALKALRGSSLCGARFEVSFRPPAGTFRRRSEVAAAANS